MKTGAFVALALLLIITASLFLVVRIGFGIERGEMRINSTDSQHVAEKVNSAGNIALVLFFVVETLAICLFLKSGITLLPRLHWTIRSLSVLIGAIVTSWIIALILLNARLPAAIKYYRALSDWIMSIAP
jgi:hypothetical protein